MKVSVQARDGKIIQGQLTTEHKASVEGRLVLVIAGKAYKREEAAFEGYHVVACDDDACFKQWNDF